MADIVCRELPSAVSIAENHVETQNDQHLIRDMISNQNQINQIHIDHP